MIFDLKSITKEIKNNICNNDMPINYCKEPENYTYMPNSIISFVCVSGDERKRYESLKEEEKIDFVSSSSYINMLPISVETLYDLYHSGISCDYDMTISMIKKFVPVNKDNEKLLFASFVILHEFGHWNDFVSKDKKPYFYMQEENERREVYELKVKILNDKSLQEKSEHKIKEQLRKWTNRYNALPCETRANDYAFLKINDIYNLFKKNGYI